MCTAATYVTKDFYFGRTLDYEFSYGEGIAITPRNYCFHFCRMGEMRHHYAMIGTAHVVSDYPLYYDGINEKGLGMAGLNFVGNAVYQKPAEDKHNVSPYEFIPWILGQCTTVKEAKELLNSINLVDIPFSSELPLSELHWIIADKTQAVTVESTEDGLHLYDNPAGVLTNNPPFNEQMFALNNYMSLSPGTPENHFCSKLPLHAYSRGMGAIGLPGDLSSQSRFVRVAFVKENSSSGDSEEESVSQFFHILGSVEQQRGCCYLGDGKYEVTLYTSCCNADKGIYYYTTYENHQISGINMHHTNLNASCLTCYPMLKKEQVRMQN
ncbi:MAG: choloylglycine hydrolase [Roseburia sp.]|nr:choloylglycine hydrolase [Roseburia sp.]